MVPGFTCIDNLLWAADEDTYWMHPLLTHSPTISTVLLHDDFQVIFHPSGFSMFSHHMFHSSQSSCHSSLAPHYVHVSSHSL